MWWKIEDESKLGVISQKFWIYNFFENEKNQKGNNIFNLFKEINHWNIQNFWYFLKFIQYN